MFYVCVLIHKPVLENDIVLAVIISLCLKNKLCIEMHCTLSGLIFNIHTFNLAVFSGMEKPTTTVRGTIYLMLS